MANLQERNEIKERFNLFQYKTVDFTLRLNIYKRKARDKTSTLADIWWGREITSQYSKCRAIIHVFRLIAQILPIWVRHLKKTNNPKGGVKDGVKEISERQRIIPELIIADPFLFVKVVSEKISEKTSEKDGVKGDTKDYCESLKYCNILWIERQKC